MIHAARALLPASLLLLAGCMAPMKLADFAASRPELRPERFFAGETRGSGVIQTSGGRPSRTFEVLSIGSAQGDAIRVDQTIRYGDGKVERRTWQLRRVGPNRYEGALSDAAGPVRAEARGNALRLRYLLKRPAITMEQWLYLQPDGRTILNEGTVRAFGIVAARISEQIVRSEPR
ncbi:MAG TPA: DUF3833 family protein [Allosphingosinicella sp.]|jgi:hypothetical protein|uniref:DUF3833 family protein n=1 Tax=Allosphingosinicella sp. TaxID=2823234 RepID=UPI002F29CD01